MDFATFVLSTTYEKNRIKSTFACVMVEKKLSCTNIVESD